MPAVPVISQPANVATPAVAARVLWVHPSVPPAFWAMAKVMLAVLVVTVFPPESATLTVGWVPHTVVLAPPLGWLEKTTWVGDPTVMDNGVLVAVTRPPELAPSVYVPFVPTIWQPVNGATPPLAVTGSTSQLSAAPVAGWEAIVSDTWFVAPLIGFPPASSTVATGWLVQVAPLAPPPGSLEKASMYAGPTPTLNGRLVAAASVPSVARRV